MSLGWEWKVVEDLTMPRLRTFIEYFEEHPPLHIVVAALAGVRPQRRNRDRIGNATTMAAFESLLAGSIAGCREGLHGRG